MVTDRPRQSAMRRAVRRLAYCLFGYVAALGVQLAFLPPDWNGMGTIVPYFAMPILTILFGPFLLVPQDAWLGSGDWSWLLRMLPLYFVHLAYVWRLLARPDRRAVRIFEVCLVACWSALGVWSALPAVERHELRVDGAKLPGGAVRLAVVSDLHSCRYGNGQRGLVEMIEAQSPDLVLMVGDMFDDRLPDGPAVEFAAEMAKRRPCVYVTGNHEFWSDRVFGMIGAMKKAGVTVLRGGCRTYSVKGNEVDVCGVDDPTEMTEGDWTGMLEAAYGGSDPSHLRVLLTHRPEFPELYARFGYDLVLSGHAHGGQWRCPFSKRGVYSPDQYFLPEYVDGPYRLSNGSTMLVSRGLARESAPVPRYFNNPEVLVVDILRQ